MRKSILVLLTLSSMLVAQVTMQTVRNMPANSWLRVPNTHLRDVTPDAQWEQDNGVYGVSGPLAIVYAWSGGAYDTKRDRLIVWGGGHNDYRGNEIYVFDVPTMKWIRFTEPTINPVNCGQSNADGTPNSRHTWGGLEYIAHADRFFASGGALNCNSGGCGADKTWTFDFDAKKWTDHQPTGTNPPTGCGNCCAYDPNTKRVFWGDNNYPGNGAGVYSYSYDSNSWIKHSSEGFNSSTAVVDPKRKLLFFIGGENGRVTVFDIGNNNFTPQVWTTTGGSNFLGKYEPGVAYDPVSDRIVCWVGTSVYALNPDAKAWTAYSPSGTPDSHIGDAGQSTGINGRWRYVPSVNAFIVVTSVDDDIYFYKLTAGGDTLTKIARPSSSFRQSFPPVSSETLIDMCGRTVAHIQNGNVNGVRHGAAGLKQGVYLLRTLDKDGNVRQARITVVK